ncbi:MAG TPA: nicotinate (nicotinamide) nucleotide adenylyltransferase [Xanthomonadales bacterium]|nr:nicotinate (nicotinamide) nucleotide adenylyltransferase [Xanthomonadales bacterium]
MKIGILGGSFDPPHIGHLLIAEQVREVLSLDRIWLLPNFNHAFGKVQTNAEYRLQMAKFLENEYIKSSDHEIKKKGTSYTIDSLKDFKIQYPGDQIFWILGSDQLESFHNYKDWREIVKKHSMIIFPRESVISELKEKTKKALKLKTIPISIKVLQDKDLILTNISSSIIRERVKKGLSIKYLVPEKIEEYIKKHKLYI